MIEYTLVDKIAVLTFDDGKANAVGHNYVDEMLSSLDKAETEAIAVVLCGKEGMFSAGFDLKELAKGQQEAMHLVSRGEAMLKRLFAYPLPLIAACTGHAIGMGAFILLCLDSRVGISSDYTIKLPETGLGMPFSPLLMTLIEARVALTHQTAVAVQSKSLTPEDAIHAGFIDELVSTEDLLPHIMMLAKQLGELPSKFYAKNKLHLRSETLKTMNNSKPVSFD